MNKLLVILGPTASGKTDLAIKLAKKYNGEVVSADSRQIYKGMNIGTAKPLSLEGVPHWLLNIKNPNQNYTVAEYKKDAIKVIRDIQKRGKLPILAGGTGLYIKSVVENLDIPKISANPRLRGKIEKEVQKKGLNFVFQKLIKLDPEAAYIVDPKNPRRVIRALEVTLLTKKPFSQQRKAGKPLFDVLEIGIYPGKSCLPADGEKLKNRINLRVDEMLKEGLIEEVKDLVKKYPPRLGEAGGSNCQAFDAIGYREIIEFLNNKKTLEQALAEIKTNTWHYAKRQMTWFRADKKVKWTDNYKNVCQTIDEFLNKL